MLFDRSEISDGWVEYITYLYDDDNRESLSEYDVTTGNKVLGS